VVQESSISAVTGMRAQREAIGGKLPIVPTKHHDRI